MVERAFPLGGQVAVPGSVRPHPEASPAYAICDVCHGPARPGCARCWSCRTVCRVLGRHRVWPVEPLCLAAAGSGIHRAVVAYKAGATPEVRAAATSALGDLLARWLNAHLECLLGAPDEPAVLVPVPSSTGGRASWGDRHPLEHVCAQAAEAAGGARDLCVRRLLAPADTPPGRLQPSALGFTAARPASLAAARLLVIDDLWASGSRALSAAAALAAAGGTVAAVVPLVRFVRPAHNDATMTFWAELGRDRARPSLCTRCDPDRRSAAEPVHARPLRRVVALAPAGTSDLLTAA